MRTLWLIPARGGSKGIPDKNLKPFCGKSLVSRAVDQAKACADKDDVIFVSTDSKAIKSEAERTGIDVPFMRPEHLASDTASTYSVIRHTLEEFKSRGYEFEKVVLLQPTSPFRRAEDIEKSISLWHPNIDMVVSVAEAKSNPYFTLFEVDNRGYLKISKGDGKYARRQDAPKVWEYNGAVYVMTVDSLLKKSISEFDKIIPYEMPKSRSIDLDTPEDWLIAEIIFERIQK